MALLASGNVSAAYIPDRDERGGFNFDNVARNEMMSQNGLKFKAAMKTGTTITGVCFKGGVVLGADTRSTNGETVADKNCEKIHYIADNIWCCGAGTSAGKTAAARRREGLPGIPELATRAARRYRFDDSTDLLAAGAAPHGHREAAARGHCVHAAQTDAVQVPGQCERRTRPGRR